MFGTEGLKIDLWKRIFGNFLKIWKIFDKNFHRKFKVIVDICLEKMKERFLGDAGKYYRQFMKIFGRIQKNISAEF